MVLTAALCVDKDLESIVVLTSDNVALVEQTARRFKAVDGLAFSRRSQATATNGKAKKMNLRRTSLLKVSSSCAEERPATSRG